MTKHEKFVTSSANQTAHWIIAYREGRLADDMIEAAIMRGGISTRSAKAIRTGDLTLIVPERHWHLAADAQAMIDNHNQAAA